MSQLALAQEAQISARHLSFLETGRSAPSREMVLRIARVLDVPLRERNAMLHAAGHAPAFSERPIGPPALAPVRKAIDLVLKGHEPFPALAVDRYWNLVAKNGAIDPLLSLVDPSLLSPPVNVVVLALHPKGLAPHIQNLGEWRAHLFRRLERQIEASGDPKLEELLRSVRDLSGALDAPEGPEDALGGIAVPLIIDAGDGPRSFLSTTTVFGTAVEVTLSEITLECFFPL
jgi:transcriptional regulator with XRE-family HTH domain